MFLISADPVICADRLGTSTVCNYPSLPCSNFCIEKMRENEKEREREHFNFSALSQFSHFESIFKELVYFQI